MTCIANWFYLGATSDAPLGQDPTGCQSHPAWSLVSALSLCPETSLTLDYVLSISPLSATAPPPLARHHPLPPSRLLADTHVFLASFLINGTITLSFTPLHLLPIILKRTHFGRPTSLKTSPSRPAEPTFKPSPRFTRLEKHIPTP